MPKIARHPQASHAAEVKGHMVLSSVLKILSILHSVQLLLTHTHTHRKYIQTTREYERNSISEDLAPGEAVLQVLYKIIPHGTPISVYNF